MAKSLVCRAWVALTLVNVNVADAARRDLTQSAEFANERVVANTVCKPSLLGGNRVDKYLGRKMVLFNSTLIII